MNQHETAAGHETCEFPGCTEISVETRYIANPAPPPHVYGLGICGEHERMIPQDMEGREILRDIFLDHIMTKQHREEGAGDGEPRRATVMERPEGAGNPGDWPPPGWPNCPTREHYLETLDNLEKLTDATPSWENPAQAGREMREFQTVLWDRWGRAKAVRRNRMIAQAGTEVSLDGEFNFAISITNPYSIGAVLIRKTGPEGTYRCLYGLIPRDPGWTGLCPALAETRGLEAIAICAGKFHDPQAMICLPPEILQGDPDKMPRCHQGRRLMGRSGPALALARVTAHHGARLRLMDACEKAGPMGEKLEELLREL